MAKREKTRWPAVSPFDRITVNDKQQLVPLNHLSIRDASHNGLDIYVVHGSAQFSVQVETVTADGDTRREEFTLDALINLLRKGPKKASTT